jgi:N6-adenosine-specific RNA methylase IME4
LLIGRRGQFPPPREDLRSSSLIEAPIGDHSAKPEAFAAMIETWYPDAVKLELFRRGPARPGWSVWGSEAKTAERPGSDLGS